MSRASALVTIPEDLVEFLHGGVAILVGTRDGDLRPATQRAGGARVHADRRKVDVFLPERSGERTIANVRDNGRLAVTFSRAIDHRTVQLKGNAAVVRAARPDEEAVTQQYLETWGAAVELIGMPRSTIKRLWAWPSVVVEVDVEAIFEQTPGPAAGVKLAGGAA